ncbi:MAG: 7-cyano-7-deazaguanine synthase [Candidatus Heimdallarchaeaceae archaeon]
MKRLTAASEAEIAPEEENPTHPARPQDFEEPPAFDIVILFSGGADSVLMVEMAHAFNKIPYCVLIDYEQLHIGELRYAKKYLIEKDIPFRVVKLHDLGVQSGLTGRGEKGRFAGVHEMHVPSRNLMFVGIAASIAEDMGIDTIWYGADFSDFINKFPDCMQPWFGAMNDILQINGPKPIKLEAPLAGLTKETILSMLDSKGITNKDMFSGYGDL